MGDQIQVPEIVFCGARLAGGCTLMGESGWMSIITAVKEGDDYTAGSLYHTACQACKRVAERHGALTAPFVGYTGKFVEFEDWELLDDETKEVCMVTRPPKAQVVHPTVPVQVTEEQANNALLYCRGQVRGWLMKAGLKGSALDLQVAAYVLAAEAALELKEWAKAVALLDEAVEKAKEYYHQHQPVKEKLRTVYI